MFAEAALSVYRLSFRFARPLLRRILARRVARGREESARLGERWGHASLPRPTGPLIWIHAASVGETVSVLPLIARLRETRPQARLLVTTVTTTAARRAMALLPEGALHQYLPLDEPAAVRRFLDHWRPDSFLLVESELWPTLVLAAKGRGVRMALVNARISARSARGWSRLAPVFRRLLASFEIVLAQTPGDAARLEQLGQREVACLGNLKFAGPSLPAEPAALAAVRAALGDRPVWLAAATHPGEETAVLAAHRTLAQRYPDLLTLIVPRHPDRGPAVAAEAEAAGLATALRSAGRAPDAAVQVYVADTLGEMGLWYQTAPIAFVGGSLVDRGGQNPLEAARLGCALLYGPHAEKNEGAADGLEAAGGLERVRDADELAAAAGRLLDDAALRKSRAAAAQGFAQAQDHIVDDVLGALAPVLPPIPSQRA